MKVTYTAADLQNPANAAQLSTIIANAKHGGFMRVNGLNVKNPKGRIANYTFQKGISYPAAVEKSLEMLEAMTANPAYEISVKRGTWQDGNGNINPTNRESKKFPQFVKVEKTYKQGDSVLNEAFLKLELSLRCPSYVEKVYTALGNGIYADENGKIYLRDLRFISREIVVEGELSNKASGEVIAIVDALKKDMPVGNYRMFALDQIYDNIALDGMEIEQETQETQETELAETETETVAETAETLA